MIKIDNLVKAFGAKRAVDGVSFAVERGEVLGFLGPNGAGKSTTMRMITGFMPPISTAFGSFLAELTNCASPIAPAAPPLLSNCTEETSFALCIAAARLRPVWSQPPPGFAGIIILSAG